MAVQAEKITRNGLELVQLKNGETGTTICILPSYGALWNDWLVENKGQQVALIDGFESKEQVDKEFLHGHKSANMSPFVCRIMKGKYTYKGKEYEFKNKFSDGSAIHGLVNAKEFEVESLEENENKASGLFTYKYRKEDAGYPFDYDIRVRYTLDKKDRMTLETTVENLSDEEIPIADGWHPYFTFGEKIDEYVLQFQAHKKLEFSKELIPTGKMLDYDTYLNPKKLGSEELDNAFLLDGDATQPKCKLSHPGLGLSIGINPLASYPILQLYTPPHRRSLAIECLSGAPDNFNNGIGLVLLKPGEKKTFSVSYTCSRTK